MDQSEIGLYIKRKRFERGLTQQDIADHLNVSVKSVSRWENGVNMPDVSLIIPLSSLLHITPEELLTGADHQESPYQNIAAPEEAPAINRDPRLKRIRSVVLILFCMAVLVLLDAIYGYSRSLIQWTVNDKTFIPHGLVYKILLGFGPHVNYNGAILSKMLMILMIISAVTILLLVLLLVLRYYSPERSGSHRSN